MPRFRITRESYRGENTIEVKDSQSSAIVFTNDRANRDGTVQYGATAFYGKKNKPTFHYTYRTAELRQQKIDAFFEAVRAKEAATIKAREERKKAPVGLEVGDVLSSLWGYEQTNIEYYQVTKISGRMVTVRQIARQVEATGWEQGKCIPVPNKFVGEPMKRQARDGAIKISSCQYASKLEPEYEVAGLRVYTPSQFTSYA